VCTHPSAVVTQFTILQPICDWRRKLETGSRLTTDAFTPPTQLNSTAELRRRRRCVLGLRGRIKCSTPSFCPSITPSVRLSATSSSCTSHWLVAYTSFYIINPNGLNGENLPSNSINAVLRLLYICLLAFLFNSVSRCCT